MQEILWKSDKQTFELLPTTTTERVEADRTPITIAQTAETALAWRMTDSNMMNVDREPVITITEHEPLMDEEYRRLIEAEMYIQDAIEYVTSDIHPEAPSGFVVEEEMLNNTSESGNITGAPVLQQLPASPEATSHLFKTNEVSDVS